MSVPSSRGVASAYLALGVGIVFLGFSGIFVRWANAPGVVTAFYRMLFATGFMAIPFARGLTRRRQTKAGRIPRRALLFAALAGLSFSGDLSFWNSGIMLSGATNPSLLGNTAPIWVGLGAYFIFHEQLSGRFWFGLVLAMSGAMVILGLDALRGFELGLGSFFGLIAGVFYAGYFMALQQSRAQIDTITAFTVAALTSTTVLLLVCLVAGLPLGGYPLSTYLSFAGLGVLVHGLGQFLFSYALGYLPASLVSPAGLGQPVMTAILAVPLLGENITPLQALGGIVVIIGVYLVQRSRLAPARSVVDTPPPAV